MPEIIVCKIAGVDYGQNGEAALQTLQTRSSGPGNADLGIIGLRKDAGGYAFPAMQYVNIYTVDSGGSITRRHYNGFTVMPVTSRIKGLNTKLWNHWVIDHNILLDTLIISAHPLNCVTFTPADDFPTAIRRVVEKAQSPPGRSGTLQISIDATSYVADLLGGGISIAQAAINAGVTVEAHAFLGTSLREMLQYICDIAQRINPALRPRFYLGMDNTAGPSLFGSPVLHVYDGALPLTSPVLRLSDTPGIPSSSYKKILQYRRDLDALGFGNYQELIDADGAVYSYTDTASVATHHNPFAIDGTWSLPPIVHTQVISADAGNALVERWVRQSSNERETTHILTEEFANPGEIVSVTWALDGLSDELYRVAQLNTYFFIDQPTLYALTLGARVLDAGESSDDDIVKPPVIFDVIPPMPPTDLELDDNVYDPVLDRARMTYSFTKSPSADTKKYHYWSLTPQDGPYGDVTDLANLTFQIIVEPGASITTEVRAVDGVPLTSGPAPDGSHVRTDTAAARSYSPDPPTITAVTPGFDAGGVYFDITFTDSPDWHHDHIWNVYLGSTLMTSERSREMGTALRIYFRLTALGNTFTLKARSVAYGAEEWIGVESAGFAVAVPKYPRPPTITTHTIGVDAQGPYVELSATEHADTHSHHYTGYLAVSGALAKRIERIEDPLAPRIHVPDTSQAYTFVLHSAATVGQREFIGDYASYALTLVNNPPTALAIAPSGTGWDPIVRMSYVKITFTAPSPTASYGLMRYEADVTDSRGTNTVIITTTVSQPITIYLAPTSTYTIRLYAVDNAGQRSGTYAELTGTAAADDQDYNLGFELRSAADNTRPFNWTITLAGNATAQLSTTARAGKLSLQLTAAGAGASFLLETARTPVVAGVPHLFGFSHKAGNDLAATPQFLYKVNWYDQSEALVSTSTLNGGAAFSHTYPWDDYQEQVTPPTNAVSAQQVFQSTTQAPGTLYLDTILLPTPIATSNNAGLMSAEQADTIQTLGSSADPNTFYAGPESGPPATATFRAIVAADLPANVALEDGANTWTAANVFNAAITGSGTINLTGTGSHSVMGNLGVAIASPSSYTHGGTNRVVHIHNSATAQHSQSHVILSTAATVDASTIGSVTWAVPNTAHTQKIGAYAGVFTSGSQATTITVAFSIATTIAGTLAERFRITDTGNISITGNLNVSGTGNSYVMGKFGVGITTPSTVHSLAYFAISGTDSSGIYSSILNAGSGQVAWSLRRTGGTPSYWVFYLPTGAHEFRIHDALAGADRFTFSSSGQLTATSFSGSGAALTNLNADNLASGTVPVARLHASVAFDNTDNAFSASQTIVLEDALLTVRDTKPTVSIGGGRVRVSYNDSGANANGERLGAFEFAGARVSPWADTVGASIEAYAAATWSSTSTPTRLVLNITDTGGSPATKNLTIDPTGATFTNLPVSATGYTGSGTINLTGTGNSYVMGNLGVRTNNPLSPLHVVKASTSGYTEVAAFINANSSGRPFINIGRVSPLAGDDGLAVGYDSATNTGFLSIAGDDAIGAGTGLIIKEGAQVGIRKIPTAGYLDVNGAVAFPIAEKTADYIMTADDLTIVLDTTSAALKATLPVATAAMKGRIYAIKGMGTNFSTIHTQGTDTIDGVQYNATPWTWASKRTYWVQCGGLGKWFFISGV